MVTKFFLVPNNSQNQILIGNKHRFWIFAICAILVFTFFLHLIYCNFQKWDIIDNALNLGFRFKNYEDLHKIYKNSFKKNTTESTNKVVENSKAATLNSFRIVCYYVASLNLTRSRILLPNAIDPFLCSHLIVGFAVVENGKIQPKSPSDKEVYRSILDLKNINPSLKVMLSVQDMSSRGELARVVSSDVLRKQFALNALTFINNSGFNGIDLDWEFPAWPDADLIQTRNFTLLLGEFRRLINCSKDDAIKNIIISVAVAAPELIMRQSYEIKEMSGVIDFVNLMSYDYHFYDLISPLTGPNAPLYRRNAESGYFETLNTNWSATHWGIWGMPLSKINVGIPTYGHSFRLINEDNNGWNAPSSGFGRTGDGNGFLSYPDACLLLQNSDTTHVFDDENDVPYAYNGNEWISYDNPISVELKTFYVKNNNYGGAMIFCLNCDDFEGECSSHIFPLTRIVSNILNS